MAKGTSDSLSPPYVCKDIIPVDDNLQIGDCIFRTYTWLAPKEIWKGRIIFIHGYRDNHVLYNEFAENIAKAGYDFFFFYQRGEGETRLVDNTKGVSNDYFAYKAIDDMIDYNLKYLEEKKMPLKLNLMGHSMGGGLALNYLCTGKYKTKLISVSVIGPLVTLHEKTHPGLLIEYIVRFICLFKRGQHLRVNSPLKAEYIAGDEIYQKYIGASIDPSGLNGAFVETRDFILRGRSLIDGKKHLLVDNEIPVLVCHGESDYVNDVNGSKKWINLVKSKPGMKNKDIITYSQARHNVLIDKPEIRSKITADIIEFLNKNN